MKKLKIYISYSHIDKEIARKFYDYLTNMEFDVIWDENTIITGDDFNKKLMSALSNSDIYLPIISNNFEQSIYTKRELLAAIGYNSSKDLPRIFPYIVYGNAIPTDLSALLCFMGTENVDKDLSGIGNQLEKLIGTIFAEQNTANENVENLNISLESYLKDVFAKLEKNERTNRRLAYFSYSASVLFLILIVVFSIMKSDIYANTELDLCSNIFISIHNVVILTVFAALSRLSFILGKSFMVEAIRNGDRIHAISFGKFYIQAYGKQASRQEIREVLGEWNIDKGSSFHTQDAKEIDPNILGILELLKSNSTK